jgi:hypothetical protein
MKASGKSTSCKPFKYADPYGYANYMAAKTGFSNSPIKHIFVVERKIFNHFFNQPEHHADYRRKKGLQ